MNRAELRQVLDQAGVDPNAYSLDGGLPHDDHALAQTSRGWEVYYSERGLKSSRAEYDTEAEACADLYERLMRDSTTWQPAPTHVSRWPWRRRG